jgi:hypothetical protein
MSCREPSFSICNPCPTDWLSNALIEETDAQSPLGGLVVVEVSKGVLEADTSSLHCVYAMCACEE